MLQHELGLLDGLDELAAGDRLGLLLLGHNDFLPKSRSDELASPPHDPPISSSQLITQFPDIPLRGTSHRGLDWCSSCYC